MRIFLMFFINITSFSSCSQRLLTPLENGIIINNSTNSINQAGVNIFIQYNKSRKVIASEKCIVKTIIYNDSSFVIVATGKYDITYGTLKKCFVKKGEHLKAGQIIGELESVNLDLPSPMLSINIKNLRTGDYITDYKIFK